MNFKTWAEAKKIKETDLIFLKSLKEEFHLALFTRLSDQMAGLTPSFSEGLAFLEQAAELILAGHNENLFENSGDFQTWKQHVNRIRYPVTAGRDAELQTRFERLPWPYGAKTRFERRGDRAGIELRLFVSSGSDLTKIISALERVQKELGS